MKKWLSTIMLFMVVFLAAINTKTVVFATEIEDTDLRASIEVSGDTKKDFVIVLDPGHGGSDPGAVRIHNGITYTERDLVLKIANYCKEELEKYVGVKVYLTRTNNGNSLMDRLERTQFALEKEADVIVSLHLNATKETYTKVSGALVFGPNKNTESGVITQELSNQILTELEKLELKNRGIVVDEGYGMVLYPKQNNIPGMIVEHAFINSPEDVANHLSSSEKLRRLGISDAQGIASYYNLKTEYPDYIEYEENAGKMEIIENEEYLEGTEYNLRTLEVPEAYSLKYAIWTEENNKDSVVWKEAVKDKRGVWKSNFRVSDYKKKGNYLVQAYVINPDDTQVCVASSVIQIKGPQSKEIVMQKENPEKGTFQIRVKDLTSEAELDKVTLKVWYGENKKDAYIYTPKLQKNSSYRTTVNIKKHKYRYGTYKVQLIAIDKNGVKSTFKAREFEFQRPELNVTIKPNKAFTTYTINAKRTLDVASLKMAVWSTANEQDDLKWYTAKIDKKNQWVVKVPYTKHKTAGEYCVDLYGVGADGQENMLVHTTFTVNRPKIEKIEISKVDKENGTFTVYIKGVQAEAGVKKVTLHAWTKDDASDVHKYTAKKASKDSYRVDMNIKDYDGYYGKYHLKAFVRDKREILRTKKTSYKFELSEE